MKCGIWDIRWGARYSLQNKSFSSFARLKFLWGKVDSIDLACHDVEVTEQAYYLWRKAKNGGMGPERSNILKMLEKTGVDDVNNSGVKA